MYGLAESLRLYRLHVESFDAVALHRDMAGRDLACWCPLDQPCHADMLLEVATPNSGRKASMTDLLTTLQRLEVESRHAT